MGVLLWMDWRLALVTFAVLPLIGVVTQWFRRNVRESYRVVRGLIARINAFLQENITGMSQLELSRRGIGRTFQTLQVFVKLSVRDNLIAAAQEFRGTLTRRLFAKPDAGLGEHADRMIELFQLRHVARLPAGTLSYGQQKLIDIAMAFMPAPRLVLLDEPCAGVNPGLVEQLREPLVQLNRTQGGSFVVIEHNMDFIMKLCPHVICMVEGKVMAEGPPAAVQSNRQVLEAYLGN
jgi:branched-chain amino acid transport system ATP-binding protein